MNDHSTPLVSRRTVAKTAAWAAPAIALAAASPAHAASQATSSTGRIAVTKLSYEIEAGGAVRIVGVLTPTDGGPVPADLLLEAECSDGFEVLVPPFRAAGDTFELLVHALPTGAASGTLTISSPNYAATWTAGSAVLEKKVIEIPVGAPWLVFDEIVFAQQGAPGEKMTLTGKVHTPEGTRLPDDIQLYADGAIEGWTVVGRGEYLVSVDPETGAFSFEVEQTDSAGRIGQFGIFWALPVEYQTKVVPVSAYTYDGPRW